MRRISPATPGTGIQDENFHFAGLLYRSERRRFSHQGLALSDETFKNTTMDTTTKTQKQFDKLGFTKEETD